VFDTKASRRDRNLQSLSDQAVSWIDRRGIDYIILLLLVRAALSRYLVDVKVITVVDSDTIKPHAEVQNKVLRS
jgi:hypothetical protein